MRGARAGAAPLDDDGRFTLMTRVNMNRLRPSRGQARATYAVYSRRHGVFLCVLVVASMLGLMVPAAAEESANAIPRKLRLDAGAVDSDGVRNPRRELMWYQDDIKGASATSDYDDSQGKYGDDDNDSSDDSDSSKQVIIGVSIGGALVVVTICLTWRACVECCTSSGRHSRHRAFIPRSTSGWKCEICFHANESGQTNCVLCGTSMEELKVVVQSRHMEASASVATASQAEATMPAVSNYLLLSSPRAGLQRGLSDDELNDRQLVARERHEWKRCINGPRVRWVNISPAAFQESEALRSTIIQERDLREWRATRRKHRHQLPASPSQVSMGSSMNFSDSSGQALFWLTADTAFARDDSHPGAVRWRLAEEVAVSSRSYSKIVLRISSLTFSEKVQWFYQYSLKLCSSIVDGYHTIRINRNQVLKQSVSLFMTAPSATLHRRLRVDFMDEPGVDGGGILREWLHLICNQTFAESQGLFRQTNSSAHQGYWINRDAARKCPNHLQMYVFFGKLLGKVLLEGLLLNVRLSIPLLKHLLGTPFKLSDMHLLDETVYSSLMWILQNDNTNSLGLNFTVEGTELIPSGADVTLHDGNKHLYVAKVVQYYLFDSVRTEIASILEGFRSVINDSMLHVFDFKELDLLLTGLPHIDVVDWEAHTELRFYEQNMAHEVELIAWFWEIVESFTQDQRGRLLQYVTGSSGVPVEGFKGLAGMDGDIQPFTIQLGKAVSQIYTVLPHASTCLNRLDLPVYASKAELEAVLLMVMAALKLTHYGELSSTV